jgi:hypothetical protein
MKRFSVIVFFLSLIILLFSGCSEVAFTSPSDVTPSSENTSIPASPTISTDVVVSSKPTETVVPENTPEVSASPTVSAVVVSSKPTETEAYSEEYYGNLLYKDAWIYYLDLRNSVETPDSEESLYYIHRMNKDGSDDKNLNILCFRFDFAGQYLYTDTNLIFGDFGHWESYRYDLDGNGEKKIDYTDMTRFSNGDRLYFSLFNESAFYSATIACTKVK